MHISQQRVIVIPVAQDIVPLRRDHIRMPHQVADIPCRHPGFMQHRRKCLPYHMGIEIFHITVPAELTQCPVQ